MNVSLKMFICCLDIYLYLKSFGLSLRIRWWWNSRCDTILIVRGSAGLLLLLLLPTGHLCTDRQIPSLFDRRQLPPPEKKKN